MPGKDGSHLTRGRNCMAGGRKHPIEIAEGAVAQGQPFQKFSPYTWLIIR